MPGHSPRVKSSLPSWATKGFAASPPQEWRAPLSAGIPKPQLTAMLVLRQGSKPNSFALSQDNADEMSAGPLDMSRRTSFGARAQAQTHSVAQSYQHQGGRPESAARRSLHESLMATEDSSDRLGSPHKPRSPSKPVNHSHTSAVNSTYEPRSHVTHERSEIIAFILFMGVPTVLRTATCTFCILGPPWNRCLFLLSTLRSPEL